MLTVNQPCRRLPNYSCSIKARSLPRFWYYSFHYMDYQRYAFELLSNVCLALLTRLKISKLTVPSPIFVADLSIVLPWSTARASAPIRHPHQILAPSPATTSSVTSKSGPSRTANGSPSSSPSRSFIGLRPYCIHFSLICHSD